MIRCLDGGDGGEGSGGRPESNPEGKGGGLHLAVDVSGLGLTANEVAGVLMEEADVCLVPLAAGDVHLIRTVCGVEALHDMRAPRSEMCSWDVRGVSPPPSS